MTNTLAKPDVIHLPSSETGFSLSDLKQIVFRRWKPALAVGAIAFVGVFIPTLLETPKYKSETLILLDSAKNKQSASVVPEQSRTGYYNLKDFSTEIMILRSYSLVAKAMKQSPEVFAGIPISEVLKKLSIHQALVGDTPTDILTVSYIDPDPQQAKAILEALGATYVDYSLERQRSQATNAIAFIKEQLPRSQQELDEAAKEIRQFRQTYNMVDPDQYAGNIGEFRQALEQEIKQAQITLAHTQREYQEISRQLAELGQNPDTALIYTVLGQDQVYQNLAAQLKGLETDHALGSVDFKDTYHVMESIQLRRAELRKLLQQRAKQLLGDAVSRISLDQVLVSQPELIAAPTEQSGSDASEANSSSQTGTSASTLQNLAHQLLTTQTKLASLHSQIDGIDRAKAQVEKDFQSVPQLQQTFAELQRKFKVKSEAVDFLLKRQQELEIAAAEEIAPWQILDAPYLPTKPVSPNIQRGLAIALVAGGFLGVATAWLLQQLDQKVRVVEEIKQLTRLPLLGTIPEVDYPIIDINTGNNQEFRSYQYSSFTEGLRALAMNLRYLMLETGRIKSLAFTSSTSSEGKTTVTYNLSLVLAELGFRVLVVDADLRKPRMHKLAKLSNERGLSNAIIGDEPWSDFVQTGITENLHILTSGDTSPNPIALLNSEKTKQLIQEWRESYDYLLMDTPPIGVMADAKSVASQVDSILFVTGIGRVSPKAIQNSLEILHHSRCNLAGFVANMVNPDFDYYAYSYYDSYYNQAYTNGNGNDNGNGHDPEERQGILQQFRRRS
ncbi:MAG: polysaccharide biosynthesis tyrosine autokinase [Xenococcaceae cyanobacterium MO_188.B32]|nr:polysaccharide biosynthesis tyrosine autokinase [Xenococcaceae cyanobacterium MO_188.B32]